MPTLLGLCGIPIPGSVDGTDYSNVLGGAAEPKDPAAFIGLPVPITEARTYGIAEYRGLRTGRYTYVRSIHGPWLLYDNERDPYQMQNLCGKAEAKSVQSSLDRALDARLRALKDEFLTAQEYLRRDGFDQYHEVNTPIGHVRSPWGDWESTLTT